MTTTTLPGDQILRGSLMGITLQGLRIAGGTAGLIIGDEVVVYPSERKIQYTCKVKHIDPEKGYWGAEITSPPSLVDTQL